MRDAEGTADPAVVSELAPGGRLGQIATLLDDAAPMPLTLQVGPETLESWNALAQTNPRLAAGVTSVKEAAARTNVQLLPAPYVPIDLTSLEAAGLGSQLPNQLRTGAQVLEQLTNVSPSSRTAFVDPVDAAALASVRDLLVDRVAVRGPSIANVSATDTLNPFVLAAGDGTLRAAATTPKYRRDPRERRLSRAARATAPRRARRHLRSSARRRRVWCSRRRRTGCPMSRPSRDLIAAVVGHPYVQPVTLDSLFANVPQATSDGAPVTHALAPHDPARFPIPAARYNRVQSELAGLRSALGPDDPDVLRGEHALDLALSTENSTAQAEDDLAVVTTAADELQRSVSTTGRRVTLTARKANVPLSFVNQTATPVTVRVQLASEKLLFPNGSDQVLVLPPGTSTEQFAVEARASGTFTHDGDAHLRRRQSPHGTADAGHDRVGRVQRRRRGVDDRRAGVPRAVVGEPLPPHAPGAPRDPPRREHCGRRAVAVIRGATGPLELDRRARHAALARHRPRARRGARVRDRAGVARRLVQPREHDAEHRLRAAHRRRPVRDARPGLRRPPPAPRRPRHLRGVHRHDDGARSASPRSRWCSHR